MIINFFTKKKKDILLENDWIIIVSRFFVFWTVNRVKCKIVWGCWMALMIISEVSFVVKTFQKDEYHS